MDGSYCQNKSHLSSRSYIHRTCLKELRNGFTGLPQDWTKEDIERATEEARSRMQLSQLKNRPDIDVKFQEPNLLIIDFDREIQFPSYMLDAEF